MKFYYSAALLFAGLAAATPAPVLEQRATGPDFVKIKGVSLLGTGCPKGSGDVQVDATGSIFEATFSEYLIEAGPDSSARDRRKNCKLTLNMEFEDGYQFSILDTNMAGFAEIPKGVKGTCKNEFSFSQNPLQRATTTINLKGPMAENFDLTSKTGIASWSPCGGSTAILNMNTQCSLNKSKKEEAIIAVDNISGSLKVKFAVQWQRCPKH